MGNVAPESGLSGGGDSIIPDGVPKMFFRKCSVGSKVWGTERKPFNENQELKSLIENDLLENEERLFFKSLVLCHEWKLFENTVKDEVLSTMLEATRMIGFFMIETKLTKETRYFRRECEISAGGDDKKEAWYYILSRDFRKSKKKKDQKNRFTIAYVDRYIGMEQDQKKEASVYIFTKGEPAAVLEIVNEDLCKEAVETVKSEMMKEGQKHRVNILYAYRKIEFDPDWLEIRELIKKMNKGDDGSTKLEEVFEKIEKDMILLGSAQILNIQ